MDENYQCLKEEATKTKQALENALQEKETHKLKLESIYKMMNKTDDELNAIFLEIESDKKNTTLPLDEEYNNSYWKWKDADEANEKAQIALKKYDENYNADIPDVMIELKEVKSQNEELRKELQEMKNTMTEMLPQMMMTPLQELTQMVKFLYTREFFSNITPAFNGQKKEVDILFLEPVEARYITFKPKSWNSAPYLRCEVYVDNFLQNTPLNQRSLSSYLNGNSSSYNYKDSTMNAQYGWLHKSPFNSNEWLKLDLQQVKTITGIRVGTRQNDANYYVSNLALEFKN